MFMGEVRRAKLRQQRESRPPAKPSPSSAPPGLPTHTLAPSSTSSTTLAKSPRGGVAPSSSSSSSSSSSLSSSTSTSSSSLLHYPPQLEARDTAIGTHSANSFFAVEDLTSDPGEDTSPSCLPHQPHHQQAHEPSSTSSPFPPSPYSWGSSSGAGGAKHHQRGSVTMTSTTTKPAQPPGATTRPRSWTASAAGVGRTSKTNAPPVYLDYNATTPISPEVADAIRPFLDLHFGNPSSVHAYGARTKKAIEAARQQVAEALGCEADEIVFTSGGTESNNYAVKGYALQHKHRGRHIITSSVEHPAIAEVIKYLEVEEHFNVTRLAVDSEGLVSLDEFEKAIREDTILVTVMHANNEVGTLMPIREMVDIVRRKAGTRIAVHTDAAQSIGKVRVRVDELGVDMLSVCAHKLYAPKGVGALYVRRGIELKKLLHGADHEGGRRPGTENTLLVPGLGTAMMACARDLAINYQRMKEMRDRLQNGLLEACKILDLEARVNGPKDESKRLPNTLSISFRGIEANTLLTEISQRVAASAGAACHSENITVSPVLTAMHVPIDFAMGTVRFSTGRETTEHEIDEATSVIMHALYRLRPSEHAGADEDTSVDMDNIRLTQFTAGLGCGCKLPPTRLQEILKGLPLSAAQDKNLLVGAETSDDAAVYQLTPDVAIVSTVDFFTPIVDDPYTYGQIAAANALSDVYAMGGTPLFALNIVAFPSGRLPMAVLQRILQGAQAKAEEAGVRIVGGHTIDDNEPKFGMAVTGTVHPAKILRNVGAKPGDDLLLTKPIGTGIITTALKRGLVDHKEIEMAAIRTMSTLNDKPITAIREVGMVNALTDITGFGLLGHLREMAAGSEVDVEVWVDRTPFLKGACEFAAAGVIPGGTKANLDFVSSYVEWDEGLGAMTKHLLTSGGLLIAISPDATADLRHRLTSLGVECAAHIGRVRGAGSGRIHVLKTEQPGSTPASSIIASLLQPGLDPDHAAE